MNISFDPRRRVIGIGLFALTLLALGCGRQTSEPIASAEPQKPLAQDHAAVAADPDVSEPGAQNHADVVLAAYAERATATKEKSDKPKFDPVAVNGKYFEGWPKPKLALVISGRQDGYLEPCGCAGLENQKGGISRRQALLADLEKRGWPTAAVDVGGLVRRFGRQAEIQFGISADSLKKMNYQAVGFGPADLRLSAEYVLSAIVGDADPKDGIFVSANVNLFDLNPKVRIVEAGGMKLGITSVLGQEYQQQVNNAEVTIQPAATALKKVVPQLRDCDVRILLAHATIEETRDLAKQFPQFEIVVTSDGKDIPPQQPEKLDGGKSRLIEVAPKAMYVIVAGFYDDPKQPVRFQRVALDSRFSDSPEMKQLMATYQDQLRELGWTELGLKNMPHPRAAKGDLPGGPFAGAESCQKCHPTAYGIWSKTKHAHATETLTKLDPARQYDPECISCHATGWNPQEFFPYVGGFDSLEKTPHLAGNQCENCHGPAAAHVAAENGRNNGRKDAERQALKLTVGMARTNVCTKCHDHDNSPEFNDQNFETKYWPKVEHKGKR